MGEDLIRISVGLEDPEDIIWDLDQALILASGRNHDGQVVGPASADELVARRAEAEAEAAALKAQLEADAAAHAAERAARQGEATGPAPSACQIPAPKKEA